MNSSSNQNIIVVKKARHARHAHHGGAWKVAYADCVTAMMAFFLVMWIVARSPQTKESIAGYFRDPVSFENKTGAGSGVLPRRGQRPAGRGPSGAGASNRHQERDRDARARRGAPA